MSESERKRDELVPSAFGGVQNEWGAYSHDQVTFGHMTATHVSGTGDAYAAGVYLGNVNRHAQTSATGGGGGGGGWVGGDFIGSVTALAVMGGLGLVAFGGYKIKQTVETFLVSQAAQYAETRAEQDLSALRSTEEYRSWQVRLGGSEQADIAYVQSGLRKMSAGLRMVDPSRPRTAINTPFYDGAVDGRWSGQVSEAYSKFCRYYDIRLESMPEYAAYPNVDCALSESVKPEMLYRIAWSLRLNGRPG